MKVFIDSVDRIGVKGFGSITAGSDEATLRNALAAYPEISAFFTPEFLATLQANAGQPKAAGSATKSSGKDS